LASGSIYVALIPELIALLSEPPKLHGQFAQPSNRDAQWQASPRNSNNLESPRFFVDQRLADAFVAEVSTSPRTLSRAADWRSDLVISEEDQTFETIDAGSGVSLSCEILEQSFVKTKRRQP
jgi:hypothetical protein